jgi:phosphatidylserine decarboxylase
MDKSKQISRQRQKLNRKKLNSIDISNYPHPIIAREGWPFIAACFIVTSASFLIGNFWLIGLSSVLFVFVFQFFRDPARTTIADRDTICSPADGRVVYVGVGSDPAKNNQALKISVFMNVFNVHSNRSPISGHIEKVTYIPGNFFNADLDKASESNERNSIVIVDDHGRSLTCVQIAGLIARRICCYVGPKDEVKRGSRLGFIRFGSRVDIYMPENSTPLVTVGDKIHAHSSALALWPKT